MFLFFVCVFFFSLGWAVGYVFDRFVYRNLQVSVKYKDRHLNIHPLSEEEDEGWKTQERIWKESKNRDAGIGEMSQD